MTGPAARGTYILLAELASATTIMVGKLGEIPFAAGVYAYIGSALGPGGLDARLGRYAAGPGRKHWHIDYFLEYAEIFGTLTRAGNERRECGWSSWVGARVSSCIVGFGSSDCVCKGHLYLVGDHDQSEDLATFAKYELKATPKIGSRWISPGAR